MTAESIAHYLGGRRSGRGWVAKCPAHQDRSPSLSIKETDGKLLVHCFGGCTQSAVIHELRVRGLWPEARQQTVPVVAAADPKRLARARREGPALARRADWWLWERLEQLDGDKRAAVDFDAGTMDVYKLRVAAQDDHWLRTATASGIISAYRHHGARHPEECERLTCAGWRWERACRNAIRVLLDEIARRQQGAERVAA